MTTWKILTAAAAVALATAACQGPRQSGGALIGAIGGGLLGSTIGSGSGQIAAIVAGTLIGGLIGSEIGAYMDEQDRMLAQQAFEQSTTAPIGQSVAWSNPQSGNSGSFQPVNDYQYAGLYCRDYYSTVVIDGRQETLSGAACRNADGTWEIVS